MGMRHDFMKVQFYEADVGYENIWASPSDDAAYVIESIPFFVYNVSLKDVVLTHPSEDERPDLVSFERVLKKSGHKTIRARPNQFNLSDTKGGQLLAAIDKTGCKFETRPPRLIAIDVPSNTVLDRITAFLTNARVPWELADPAADL